MLVSLVLLPVVYLLVQGSRRGRRSYA